MEHYIVTNRNRTSGGGYGGELRAAGNLDFLHYPDDGEKSRIREDRFFSAITTGLARQMEAASADDDYHHHDPHRPLIVIFIHGYNTSFVESERWAGHVGKLAEELPGPPVVVTFSWPSEGKLSHYLDDRSEARQSSEAFFGLMQKTIARLEQENCAAELVVVAHSMGNYLLAHAAAHVFEARGFPGQYSILAEALMVAADVDDNGLEDDRVAQYIPRIARRVHVYRSRHDRALLASSSKRAGVTGGRLGRQGPANPDAIPENVVVIDASDVTRDVDWPPHSAHLHVPATLYDMRDVIRGVDRDEIPNRVPVEDVAGEFRLATEEDD